MVLAVIHEPLLWSIWVHFYLWCKVRVSFHSFACGYPVVPTLAAGETILSLVERSWHPCGKAVDPDVWVWLWTLDSVPLACMSASLAGLLRLHLSALGFWASRHAGTLCLSLQTAFGTESFLRMSSSWLSPTDPLGLEHKSKSSTTRQYTSLSPSVAFTLAPAPSPSSPPLLPQVHRHSL